MTTSEIKKLTPEDLNTEYVEWIRENGMGKNDKGLRFGQYLHFKYDVPMGLKGESDGFYTEKANIAHDEILSNIQ